MQNFIYSLIKNGGMFILLFSYAVDFVAMEVVPKLPVAVNEGFLVKPYKSVFVFDPKQAFDKGRSWKETVPGTLLITPDEKNVLMGKYGSVWLASLIRLTECNPELLFEHPNVKHIPMIAVAQKKDGTLLIVSAGNYRNNDKQQVSEYMLSYNGYYKVHKLDWPIQAITVNSLGTTLAIAGQNSVMVIDLESQVKDTVPFSRENKIVDIAITSDCTFVVAADVNGAVQLMSLYKKTNGDISLFNMTKVCTDDIIKKIYYPTVRDLLYITHDGKVKMINSYLFNDDIRGKAVPSVFAQSGMYDLIAVDPGEHYTTVHWTNNLKIAEHIRRVIKIYRKTTERVENCTLELPDLKGTYNYITESGQCEVGLAHVLLAAIRGKHVVALTTDGKMSVWSLPEEGTFVEEVDESEKGDFTVDNRDEIVTKDRLVRRRSKSMIEIDTSSFGSLRRNPSSIEKLSPVSENEQDRDRSSKLRRKKGSGSPRKNSSSSLIQKFTGSTSPKSRHGSPANSPHSIDMGILEKKDSIKEIDTKEKNLVTVLSRRDFHNDADRA